MPPRRKRRVTRKKSKKGIQVPPPHPIVYWLKFGPGVSIMRGNIGQSSVKFGSVSRSRQGSANAVVAISYSTLKHPSGWTPADLDEIVNIGDELYRTTCVNNKFRMGTSFPPSCIHPTFYVGYHEVSVYVDSQAVSGDLLKNNIESQKALAAHIEGLSARFMGMIVIFGRNFLSFWKRETKAYCFSPDDLLCVNSTYSKSFILRGGGFEVLVSHVSRSLCGKYLIYGLKVVRARQVQKALLAAIERGAVPSTGFNLREIAEESEKGVKRIQEVAHVAADAGGRRGREKEQPKEVPKEPEPKQQEPEITGPTDAELMFSADYVQISSDRGILTGATYVKEPEKLLHTNVAAAILLYHVRSYMWAKSAIADILKLGVTIYNDSEENDVIDRSNWQETVYCPIIFAKKNFNVTFKYIVFGTVTSTDNNVADFGKGIKYFFEQCDVGIVIGPQMVLIWQERGVFYMFDPKERDGLGRKWTRSLSNEIGGSTKGGAACITWFKNSDHLAQLYISNIHVKYQRDAFRISSVKIEEITQFFENFENWVTFKGRKEILSGKINLCEKNVEKDNTWVSKIFCANVMAAMYSLYKPEDEWEQSTIDEILQAGIDHSRKSGDKTEEIEFHNIKKSADVQGQAVQIKFGKPVMMGLVFQSGAPMGESGNAENYGDLLSALSTFFFIFSRGILKVGKLVVGIWSNDDHYYVFYPYEKNYSKKMCMCDTDINKDVTLDYGTAIAMRFKDVNTLYNEVINYSAAGRDARYQITGILATASLGLDEKPPLKKYADFRNGAILRTEDIHEGHDLFLSRADKQTLANVLVAISLSQLDKAEDWSESDIVDILKNGDSIYCQLLEKLKKECMYPDPEFLWKNIKPSLALNNFNFQRIESTGPLVKAFYGIEEDGAEGPEGGKDLLEVLEDWSKTEDPIYAVLETDFYTVAIWKNGDLYFVFDPKANDESGYPSPRRIHIGTDIVRDRYRVGEGEEEGEAEEGGGDFEKKHEEPKVKTYDHLSNDGSAYVAWFIKPNHLADHLLSKFPSEFQTENYKLSTVKIYNTLKTAGGGKGKGKAAVGLYRTVVDGMFILRASVSQNDVMFANRGKQEAANVVSALAFAVISSPDKWSPTILDIILKYGDRLCSKSLSLLKSPELDEVNMLGKMEVRHLAKAFSIYNIRYKFELRALNKGSMNSGDGDELRKLIIKIETIDKSMGAVLTLKTFTVALWKVDASFFLFDPYENDPSGGMTERGFAFIMKFARAPKLMEFLLKKYLCSNLPTDYTLQMIYIQYNIPGACMPMPDALMEEKMQILAKITDGQSMFTDTGNQVRSLYGFLLKHDTQKSFMCLAALIHSRLYVVELWNATTFDQVLCLAKYLKENAKSDLLPVPDVRRCLTELDQNFIIGNTLCHVVVSNLYQGQIFPSGQSNEPNIPLIAAIKMNFSQCTHSIVTADNLWVAIWKEYGIYYLFHDNSTADYKVQVLASPSIDAICEFVEKNLKINEKTNWYELKNIKIVVLPLKKNFGTMQSYDSEYCKYEEAKVNPEFKALPNETEVLISKKAFQNQRFYGTERYLSSAKAACAIAAGMSQVIKVCKWTAETLQNIIKFGEMLYVNSVAVHRKQILDITELEKNVILTTARLHIDPLPPCKDFVPKDLLIMLKYALQKYKTAYAYTNEFCVTMMLEDDLFYLFHPNCFTSHPKVNCNSTCLLKFITLEQMIEQISKIVDTESNILSVGPITIFVKR